LATDALLGNGGQLAELSPDTKEALNKFLPEAWSHSNPIDTLGDSGPELYVKALEIAAADPNCDAVLSILAPQGMTEPEKSAILLSKAAESINKPLLASWMGGARMQLAANVLNEAKIPTFEYPDAAARIFAYMWRYSSYLQALYEAAEFTGDLPQDGPRRVAAIIAEAQRKNRNILTEHESKQILAAYELPTTPSKIALSADDAVKAAEDIGYPVVLKLHSETVTHKSDRGGVILNLADANAVRAAFARIEAAFASDSSFHGVTVQPMISAAGYELILGSSTDPQFGPVMVFGLGGQLVEVMRDRAHALPPLTTTLARRMMENTRIFQALKGVRGRAAVNLEKLEELLVRFSELVIENPRIADIEINPLLAGADGIVALDARVILHPAGIPDSDLPRPAIRPYPTQYVSQWQSNDGTSFTLRPIRPDDESLLVDFHHQLSETSVYMRFFLPLKLDFRVSHERLFTKCFIDYDREIALVAEYNDEQGARRLAGVARLIRKHSDNNAEVAFLIADKFQNRGLGTHLLDRMIDIARKEGLSGLEGATLSDNYGMKDLFARAGFRFSPPEDGVVTALLELH
ncbi:MAG TPA: GNAT family N-acetyltransferase, partial [Candidatus Limnocylindrales bacterium]|nr:GNAT family N-acetyltransferase [Candidatus Limnocylindrales bacterium]